jgi:hypothetical protein
LEFILLGATVWTLDPQRPRAEAVAWRGERIVAVGSEAEARAAAPHAEVLRADGGLVLPGLTDAHGHLLSLGRALASVDLVGTRSYEEVVARVRAAASGAPLPVPGSAPRAPAGEAASWLRGRGWDQNDWPSQEFPHHAALSAAVRDRPVYLTRVDGHAVLLNARGLQLAGIGAATPDPPGGRILRGPDGAPTGVLVDNAMDLAKLPEPGTEERRAWLRAAMERCLALGLTGVHDAGADRATREALAAMGEDADASRLPLRIYAMLLGSELDFAHLAPPRAAGPAAMLESGAVKIYADGALGSRGALLFEDYADDPGNRGLALLAPEVLRAQVEQAARAGLQPAVHAIGDRANAEALDAFAAAPAVRPRRPRIEHAQVVRREDLARFAALGAVASMQPMHAASDMPWAPQRLGPARLRGAYAWRWFLDAGVPLAFGSDFPVESPDPRMGIHAAMTARPEHALSAEEAVRAFTSGAAYARFAEDRLGRVAPGFLADLTVFAAEPRAAQDWLSVKLVYTIVGGEVRWPAR